MSGTTHLNDWETFVTIAMLAAGILATRVLPFALFARRRLPDTALRLGRVLPHAAMTLLLVYCLKDVPLVDGPHGLPELAALVFTVAVHLWRNNALLSIAGGTALHMALVQLVFS